METPKKYVLTEEHKAKMAAGRVAAAAKRAIEKATPVTPTKLKETVCPPTPQKAEKPDTPEAKLLAMAKTARIAKRALEKAEHEKKVAERREVKTKARMIEAAAPLAYYKKVLAAVETIAGEERTQMLAYINTKIEDLEMDVAGKARYAYVVAVKEDNGDTDWSYTKVLKTSQEVSAFVAAAVSDWKGDYFDEDDSLNDPLPTAESIDALVGNAEYGRETHLYAYVEPYVSCLSFTLNRNRMN